MQQLVLKKHSAKKPLIIVLSIFSSLLVLVGILTALILSDPNRGQSAPTAKAGDVLTKLGVAAISGESARLTTEEVNGLLADQFPAHTPQFSINSDNTVALYLPADYKGIHIGITANMTVGCDPSQQQVYAVIHSLYFGRLPVDPSLGLSMLKKNLPQNMTAEGNAVRMDSAVFDTGLFGEAAGLQISDLEVTGRYFVVSISGNLNKLREFIVQTLPGALQNLS